jgi:hypothetical protein
MANGKLQEKLGGLLAPQRAEKSGLIGVLIIRRDSLKIRIQI